MHLLVEIRVSKAILKMQTFRFILLQCVVLIGFGLLSVACCFIAIDQTKTEFYIVTCIEQGIECSMQVIKSVYDFRKVMK